MNWIQEHYIEIFAIIGALYTAARTIVALTPTPKDDQYVAQIGKWLQAIGKIVGLDLKQGVEKKTHK